MNHKDAFKSALDQALHLHIQAGDRNLINIDNTGTQHINLDTKTRTKLGIPNSQYDLEGYDSKKRGLHCALAFTGLGIAGSTAAIIALSVMMGLTPFVFIPVTTAIICIAGCAISGLKLKSLEEVHLTFVQRVARTTTTLMIEHLGLKEGEYQRADHAFVINGKVTVIGPRSLTIPYQDGTERSLL